MTESEFPYASVRAVRDETGASHDECRAALRANAGDVAGAVAWWFEQRRSGASVRSHPARRPHVSTESAT